MKNRMRTYYTDAQKALMWERWKQGWTLHQIGQLFNRAHTSVQGILARTGGFRPPQRSRSKIALAEREEISRGGRRPIRSLYRCTARSSSIDSTPTQSTVRRRTPERPVHHR